MDDSNCKAVKEPREIESRIHHVQDLIGIAARTGRICGAVGDNLLGVLQETETKECVDNIVANGTLNELDMELERLRSAIEGGLSKAERLENL